MTETSNPMTTETCACNPFPSSGEGEQCSPCSPNMIITCHEVAILGKMRDIKGRVRDITAKLKEIRQELGQSPSEEDSYQPTAQLAELTFQLDALRDQWKDWEHKLDDAIETKLILLGHRQPRS